MGATQRLTERFAFTGGKVRRPGVDGYTGAYPLVEGVLLCGPASKNRRRYTREAFAGDRVKRYEGRPVNVDHGSGGKYASQIGWVENARHRADGMPIGDIGVKPTHPLAESFLFDAEHRPANCGMSHIADCRTTRAADGWDDVTAVEAVESVDLVVGPATVKSLFEQTHRRSAVISTFRKVIESLESRLGADRRKLARRVLVEMDDGGDAMGMIADAPVEEPAPDADPDAAIDDAFRQVFHSQVDALLDDSHTLNEFVSKIKDLYKTRAKLLGKADSPAATDVPAEEPGDAVPAEESKRPSLAGLISEARAAGIRNPTVEDVAAVEGIRSAAARKTVFERFAAAERVAETPRSSGKRPGAGELPGKAGATGTTKAIESVPTAGDKFADLLKG